MSAVGRPIDGAIVEQLSALVQAHAPQGRVMTFAEIEVAVGELLERLGPQLMERVLATQAGEAEERGRNRSAVGHRRAGGGRGRGRC